MLGPLLDYPLCNVKELGFVVGYTGEKKSLSCKTDLTIYSDNKSLIASSDFEWTRHFRDKHCILLYCACHVIIS